MDGNISHSNWSLQNPLADIVKIRMINDHREIQDLLEEPNNPFYLNTNFELPNIKFL